MAQQLWYKDSVMYAIDIPSFQDGNGDGIGDFPGATRRIDYLADLGVNCVWLLPFYKSPFRDNGYDIADYYSISESLGTLHDFVEFVHTAGERGIRVLIDLVVNHTSDQHPWFLASRNDPDCRFRDYYLWSSPPPLGPEPKNIFPDEEKAVWTYDEAARAYYYHLFYRFEPQLKFANPAVRDEVFKIMDFWLSFGIAGFRMDAASHIVESENLQAAIPEKPHTILKQVRRFLDQRRPGGILLGESNVRAAQLEEYFGQGDEINTLFNFLLNGYMFLALAQERKDPVQYCLGLLPTIPHSGHWINFLRNLDELDLEMLPAQEKQKILDTFDPQKKARIFGRGLRRRLAPLLEGDRRRIRMAFSLMFSMPGSPMIVYGDEIGMGDDLSSKGRDAVRTPMQWSSERNAGFSDTRQPKYAPISGGRFGYKQVNVARQAEDPDSLLSWIKQLIQVRMEFHEIGWGTVWVVPTDHPAVLVTRCEWQGAHSMTIHNLSGQTAHCTANLVHQRHGGFNPRFGNAQLHLRDEDTLEITLEPYGYQWIHEGVKDIAEE